jgi:hypothetical protein
MTSRCRSRPKCVHQELSFSFILGDSVLPGVLLQRFFWSNVRPLGAWLFRVKDEYLRIERLISARSCEMGLSRLLHYVKFPLERGRCGFLLYEELRTCAALNSLGLGDFGLLPASKMHTVSLLRVQQRPKRSRLRGNSEQGSQ